MADREYPIHTRVRIDSVDAYCTVDDLGTGQPTILDGLSFTWGRSSAVDQPEIGSCTFTIREQTEPGNTPMGSMISPDAQVEIWIDADMPDGGVQTRIVWAGTVVTAVGQASSDHAIEVAVTATEIGAQLADETIGDTPWEVEPAVNRATRILNLARTETPQLRFDSTISDILLSRQDVDAQPPLDLLYQIAESVGGVLWLTMIARQATSISVTPQLWIEDPSRRPAHEQFVINPDSGQVTIEPTSTDAVQLSANDLLRDSVQWTRDKTNSINAVDVTWLEQTVDEDGKPATESHVTKIVKPGSKIVRTLSVDTLLQSEVEADNLAARWLSMMNPQNAWTAAGFSMDTSLLCRDVTEDVEAGINYEQRLTTILDLLDSVNRIGAAISVSNMPTWAPQQGVIYVEGGTYTLEDRQWLLELNVSTGNGESARFADFAGTQARPIDFEPSIRGVDAWGVAGPDTLPPFYDMERDGDTAYVSAHRGGSYIVPEGTTVGRLNALELGMQVIDGGDIHATKDGVLYDMHDATVDRTTNLTGPISELTAAELEQGVIDCSVWFGGGWEDQPISSIADTLDELGGRSYITLEIKQEDGALQNCSKAVQMIAERGLTEQVLIASYHENLLQPAITAGHEVMLLKSNMADLVDDLDLLNRGIRYVGSSTSMSAAVAKQMTDNGLRVVTYATQRHAQVDKYRTGASGHLYGYISDDPYYLKGHVLGTYDYRRTTDPFNSLTWYHGFQPDNGDVHPDSRGSFTVADGGAFFCAPVKLQRRAWLQGWGCPITSPSDYTITYEQDFQNVAPNAGGGLIFGCPTDAPYTGDNQKGGGTGGPPGYEAFLFTTGLMRVFRRDEGAIPVVLGDFQGMQITPGTPTKLSITVSGDDITFTNITTGSSVTVTDATYRGAYFHLLALDDGANAGVRWRNITIGGAQ